MFLQEEFGCSHFLLTNKVFSCLATSPSSWRPALPACSLLERRETSSQALSRWGTLVSRSSTNQGGPRPCPRKGHFWTCQIRMEQWKAFFSNLFKTFWAQLPWILLVALFVRLIKVQQPPLGLVVHLFSWHVGLRQEGHLTLESGKDQVSFMPLDHL